MHPTHPSVPPIILRLAVISLILLCTPTWIQIKFFWTCLGVEFFVLWRLRELEGGKRRRVLNPIWWLLLGAPTDAEYAQYILQKRGLAGNPLKGSKTIKRISKSRASLVCPSLSCTLVLTPTAGRVCICDGRGTRARKQDRVLLLHHFSSLHHALHLVNDLFRRR